MAKFENLYHLMTEAKTIIISGHYEPDGDCYGCQIGLRNLLRLRFPEKKILAIGTGIPALFSLVSPMDVATDEDFEGALGILVDVSCLRRCEDQRMERCAKLIKFDHHDPNRKNEYFEGESYVDHHRVSCAELICEFAWHFNMAFDKVACNALYIGIATDSGKFCYYGTKLETFQAAAFLIKNGADPVALFEIVYHETKQEKAYKKWMRAHAKKAGHVTYIAAHPSDYQAYGLDYGVASTFVNALAGRFDCKQYVYFCERDPSFIKVELRSNKRYPVQPTAMKFGGGGHRYASGMEIVNGQPTIEEILEELNSVTCDVVE